MEIRNERGNIKTDITEIQRTIELLCRKLYTSKLDILEKKPIYFKNHPSSIGHEKIEIEMDQQIWKDRDSNQKLPNKENFRLR